MWKKLPYIAYIWWSLQKKTSHSFTLPARNPPVNPTACPLCRGYSTGSSGIFSGIFPSPPLLSKKANTLVKGSFHKNPTEIANKSGCLFFGVSGFQKNMCQFSLVEKTNDTRRISMNSSRCWSWNLKKSHGPILFRKVFLVIETSAFWDLCDTVSFVHPAGPPIFWTSFGAIFGGSLTTIIDYEILICLMTILIMAYYTPCISGSITSCFATNQSFLVPVFQTFLSKDLCPTFSQIAPWSSAQRQGSWFPFSSPHLAE